ncbi:MAG: molybdopterin molybdotransferase MoeA [Acetobacteraceae bacterium]|nr:molybdopterin molybdotransferase MoeA [Acetobacteraceae bacterium]
MAQLSDDCFAFGGKLLPLDAALRLIASDVRPIERVERVSVGAADGRVLAESVAAPLDLPPFDNSAVDGYAVRLADLDEAPVLPVAGRIAAGAPAADALAPGSAWRIFTGAALPAGADTVFMQEDVRLDEQGRVHFPPGLRRGANTRSRGEDMARGACALPAGRRLRPQDLALAAALGLHDLAVCASVRVALFSTGNEIVEPGAPAGPAQRYDSNRVLLAALTVRAGAQVTDLGILPDQRGAIEAALSAAAPSHDLILTSGGVSTGEEDHVRAAVEAAGRLVFWRLAIKPGRPVAMGDVAGVPFVGLPGNPVAAFVTFVHVARPLIAVLGGAPVQVPTAYPVQAAFSYRKKAGRREYVRARLIPSPDGTPQAHKYGVEGAGILTSLTETNGLVELAEPVTAVVPGDGVGFLPYEMLL